MNHYATQQLVNFHQHELMAEADHARLAKQARLAARGNGAPARQPLIWLRETASGIVARLATTTLARATSH